MIKILVIEKQGRARALLRCRLAGHVKVKAVSCIAAAIEKLSDHQFDLILWIASSDPAAFIGFDEKLKQLASRAVETTKVVLTGSQEINDRARQAHNVFIKDGPIDDQELMALINTYLDGQAAGGQSQSHRPESLPVEFEGIIAISLPMRAVIRRILEAAAVDIPVLITGETGTGKDLVAAAIHRRSRRANNAYIPVNTGAIARDLIASELFGHEKGAFTGAYEVRPGIFEQADHGTVFLDEIATMDEKSQVSLLRVLEDSSFRRVGGARTIGVDVRIIAASNEDLEKKVAEKRFREDLFYRLNVFHISLPPLRARPPGAITALADHFISRFAEVYGKEIERVSPEAYRLLRRYPWPGNVRELKNVIQTALLMADGGELKPEFFPERIRKSAAGSDLRTESTCHFRIGASLQEVQKEFIRMTLAHVSGNKKLAASILGISRRALYNKMRKNNLM
jgi:DNA-binding NtrC family response regulator